MITKEIIFICQKKINIYKGTRRVRVSYIKVNKKYPCKQHK
jgi:hypothetical protein